MYRLLKPIYNRLPIAARHKLALKSYVYTNFAPLFARSYGYRAWAQAQQKPDTLPKAARPQAPGDVEWQQLLTLRLETPPPLHGVRTPVVVVPVYRGHDETLACLYSVLRANPHTTLIAMDDASPDAMLVEALQELAASELFRLERNAVNLGFVATANAGMDLVPERDVVLLNSDTQVFGDWLLRLQRHADSAPDVGTVTPLSNNGEICSYPYWLADNDAVLELDSAQLDALTADANRGSNVDAPTGVGFCMYLSRRCLDQVGSFDPAFGAGYGEENDFCLRASERGWRHLIAGDVFVRHLGSVSFGDRTLRLRERGLRRVVRRFPRYEQDVGEFTERDPVRPIRVALDLARLARAAPHDDPIRNLLIVTHRLAGGIERHVADLSQELERAGANVYLLRPVEGLGGSAVGISRPDVGATPNVDGFRLHEDRDLLVTALQKLGIDHVHVHSLSGYEVGSPERIGALCRDLHCPYDVTLHDYQPVCPRVNLVGRAETYCGEPDASGCTRCLRELGSPSGRPPIGEWRERWAGLLQGARRVFCPSRDARARFERYFPTAPFVLRPHPESVPAASAAPSGSPVAADRTAARPLRVAVIGAIGPHKGARVLLECARDAAARELPLEFILVGFSDRDDALRSTGKVSIAGAYDEAELQDLLARASCHLALFPSVWPETYSYTLSAAFAAGLLPVAFDLGAPAERISECGWGRVLPLELQGDPSRLNDLLLAIDTPPQVEGCWNPHRYGALVRDYYDDFEA